MTVNPSLCTLFLKYLAKGGYLVKVGTKGS